MLFSRLFVALNSLGLAVRAAPTESAENRAVWLGIHTANETEAAAADLEKRGDSCGGSRYLINKSDISALQRDLQNNNPNELKYLPKQSWTGWVYGSALVCVHNYYLFENTHVKRWEAGWAVGYISGRCCTAENNPQWYEELESTPRWRYPPD
jgi:hypothetical protein